MCGRRKHIHREKMRSQERTIEVQWGWGCECIKIYEQIQSNKNDGIMTEGHLQKLMYILCFSQGEKNR